jgi:hypothetical protein
LGCKEGLQAVKAALPFGAAGAEPAFREPDGGRDDGAGPHPADLFAAHQAAVFKDLKVLHNRWQAHGEGPGKLRDRRRTITEPDHHGPPGLVGQRLENKIQVGLWMIVKHILKYSHEVLEVNPWSKKSGAKKLCAPQKTPGTGKFFRRRAPWCCLC